MATNYSKYIDSTGTHYISNSGSDENGRYKNGTAGDQTGKEWQLKAWYNRPWSCVLRYPVAAVGMKIAELGIDAALNNKIGYDQNQRTTYWTQLAKANYDPAAIKTACEEDCTAGVTANVKAVGYLMGIKALQNLKLDTYSANMRSRFKAAGFEVLTASKYRTSPNYLMPGDILLYDGHHAATNITYGSKVTKPSKTSTSNKEVVVTGDTVNVRIGPNKNYESIGIAKKNEKLPYQGVTTDGWHLVKFKNRDAWITSKWTKLS